MKRFLGGLLFVVLAAALVSVVAQEKAPAPATIPKAPVKAPAKLVKAPPLLEDITLQGKLTKEEGVKKTKNGDVKYTKYVLTLADGSQVIIPAPAVRRKGPPGIDIDQFLDRQVTIVGKGYKTQEKTKISLRNTVAVTAEAAAENKAGDAPAAAQVTPAVTTEPATTAAPTPAPAK